MTTTRGNMGKDASKEVMHWGHAIFFKEDCAYGLIRRSGLLPLAWTCVVATAHCLANAKAS